MTDAQGIVGLAKRGRDFCLLAEAVEAFALSMAGATVKVRRRLSQLKEKMGPTPNRPLLFRFLLVFLWAIC